MDGTPQPASMRYKGPAVDERGYLKKHELRLGAAESLAVMTAEYAFFTPAVLYLHGDFYDGPLIDLMYELSHDVPFYYRRFHRPLFRGLEAGNGDADWNHVLWAVRQEHFKLVADFIVGVTFVDREAQKVICFGEQSLTILDPLALDRCVVWRSDLPTLAITAFGVSSNRCRAAFVTGRSLLVDTPKLTFFARDPLMGVYADAAFAGKNPVDARNALQFAARVKEAKDHESKDGIKP